MPKQTEIKEAWLTRYAPNLSEAAQLKRQIAIYEMVLALLGEICNEHGDSIPCAKFEKVMTNAKEWFQEEAKFVA